MATSEAQSRMMRARRATRHDLKSRSNCENGELPVRDHGRADRRQRQPIGLPNPAERLADYPPMDFFLIIQRPDQ